MVHKHRPKSSITRAFGGPVSTRENRAAHGNIVIIATCSCGATRRRNVNGSHAEQGPWIDEEENAKEAAKRAR